MSRLKIVIDIDGTLCPIKAKSENYSDLIPYKNVVNRLIQFRDMGAYIVLNTSRNMKTYEGNIGLINANTAKILIEWLDNWEIPYDEIIYAKPWPGDNGFFVDDRSIRPDEFIKYSLSEINDLITNSKKNLDGLNE